ncbi:MAG: polysaccharide biosynthesis C-terminal domain-containing protein [Lachnospiraceae bacterium]|nr:polysaccharide biosynthesis C-terminal domain-containing protein [Lachnospiraceae bacterium]
MKVAKKGLINILCGVLGQVIAIGLGIIIPRLVLVSFGSEVNGLLNSVNQIIVYFSLFEAGIGLASMQALYAPVAGKDHLAISKIMKATHLFYKKAGIAYGLSVIVLAFVYPFFVNTDLNYWLIFMVIIFTGFAGCLNFAYQGKYKILLQAEGYTYVVTNITTIINVLVNVTKTILLFLGFDVLSVQFSFFLINVIQILIYKYYINKHYSWLDFTVEPDNKAIEQKNATLIHQISGMIFSNTDVLLLTVITHNLKIVSIYTMYNLIITMVTTMFQQVSTGFDFRLGQLYNTEKKTYFRFHDIFEIVYLIIIFATMTVVYILILPFMRLYTAGVNDINYINSMYPLIFVIVPLLSYGRTAPSNLINYAGHFKKTQWRALAESIINICVSIFGIIFFGIYGALLGTIVASLYRTNDMIIYVYRHLMEGSCFRTYKRWIVNFIVFACVVLFVNNDNRWINSYPRLLLVGIILTVVSFLVYILAQLIINPKEFKNMSDVMKDTLKNRGKKDGK